MSAAELRAAQFLTRLRRTEELITGVAFATLVVVLFADVVSRELTGAGLTWSRQIGVYANLFLTLVGIGLASAAGTHLRPRFADRWLPVRYDRLLETLRETVMALFFAAAAAVSVATVAETRALGERVPLLGWPVWGFQVVMPAVFIAAALRHLCYARFPGLRPCASGGLDGVAPEAGSPRP